MNFDRLYELAFEYRKTKIWEKLADNQVFAVHMPDDQIGYVCIMGNAGEFNGLNVYMGDAFYSWKLMQEADPYLAETEFEEMEMMLQQDCMQLELCAKDQMLEEDLHAANEYARKRKIRLSGKYACPSFHRYRPGYHPWKIEEEKDAWYLEQAIEAAIALSKILAQVEVKPLKATHKTVFCMEYQDGRYVQGKRCHLPKMIEKEYPSVDEMKLDQMTLHKVKKLRRKDVLECGFVMMPTPAQKTPESAPFYPYILMAVQQKNGRILEFVPVSRDEYLDAPEQLVNMLLQGLLKEKVKPQAILCQDERTCALLRTLAVQFGVPIEEEIFLETLEEAQDGLLEYLDRETDMETGDSEDWEDDEDWDEMDEEDAYQMMMAFVDMILSMPKSALKTLPKEMIADVKELIRAGVLPKETERKLKQKLGI